MRNGDKHGKFYKKLVRTLAMVYVFFVVLKRKPKYIAYFSAVILCPLLLIGLAIGSLKMLSVWNDDKTSDASTNQVEYFEEAANDVNEDDIDWQSLIDIDMKSIIAANPDVIGWLYFETEDTSYPILYTDEYDKNIKSKYTGVYTVGGTTLLEGKNSPDFDCADKNYVIAISISSGNKRSVIGATRVAECLVD